MALDSGFCLFLLGCLFRQNLLSTPSLLQPSSPCCAHCSCAACSSNNSVGLGWACSCFLTHISWATSCLFEKPAYFLLLATSNCLFSWITAVHLLAGLPASTLSAIVSPKKQSSKKPSCHCSVLNPAVIFLF